MAPRPSLVDMSTEVWTVDSLLGALWDAGGTDLHLSAMSRPLIRVHMDLIPLAGTEVMKPAEIERLARELLTDEQLDDCRRGHDVDFSFGWRGQARIRGNAYRQRNTVALALRIMPHTIPSFDDLGIPMSVRELAAADQGLILVTGPTGSGKSTTLATMLDWIAANPGSTDLRLSCDGWGWVVTRKCPSTLGFWEFFTLPEPHEGGHLADATFSCLAGDVSNVR